MKRGEGVKAEAAACWAGCWGTGGSWAGCWAGVEQEPEVVAEFVRSAAKGEMRLSQLETAIKELSDLAKKK